MSTQRLFLPPFRCRKGTPLRVGSDSAVKRSSWLSTGRSILMTSAPMSAMMRLQKGPTKAAVKSNTLMPDSNGIVMRGLLCGNV